MESKNYKEKKDNFEEKILDIRRVARVTAGGKRFKFRVSIIIGDKRGKIGIGIAKGFDIQEAISKAKHQAEKNLFNVPIKNGTIPSEIEAKYSAAKVRLKPAKPGHGLMAGGSVRSVLELGGVRDVTAKILGKTKNKLTNALATIKALKNLEV